MDNIKYIESLTNPTVKKIVSLHTKKGRQEEGLFIAEGLRTCQTIAASSIKLSELFVTYQHYEELSQVHGNLVTIVSEQVMKKISTTATPSGILGVFKIPAQPTHNELGEGIILYEVADPGNIGTLIRTCAAMNKKTVICIGTVDPWNPKVVQATAGTIALVTIFTLTWQELLQYKKQHKIAALVVSNVQHPDKVNFSDTLIMIGNEARGLPDDVIAQSDVSITLPMPGNTESLNASIAGSIAMYLAWH